MKRTRLMALVMAAVMALAIALPALADEAVPEVTPVSYTHLDVYKRQPKGSTFKGPFHLPRMLSMVDQMMGQVLDKK